ncbi:hypothetical protein [Schlesneria sp. DSM 10557]|uniref:hypothetical protein n=1 Tax=Schlesneria sp. DSM 10557 TaxID=3044399 RepID=UPI0035A1BF72
MTTPNQLPAEALSILDQLKSRIRSYVFWEGLALVVVVLGLLFWSSFAFDWAYFQLSHLELPRWFRAAVLIAGISLVTLGACSWIGLRLFRGFRTRALALVLERRFPELDDRLITAVEASEGLLETDSPVTAAMLQRTLKDVTSTASRLDLGSVFDSRPLRRAIVGAVVLVASIFGMMVVDSAAMERWAAGYLGLKDGYWTRETELVMKVVVQPGDRIRDFVEGHYRHPKGGDLTVVVEVPEGKKPPRRIRLDSQMGRRTAQIWLTPSADQVFRHTFIGLIEGAQLWVSGGDYRHSDPYVVDVVPPPEVTRVTLHSLFPEYTGLNTVSSAGVERTSNELNGSQISLPLQTDFILEITANKPLTQARIEGDVGPNRWEITLTHGAAGASEASISMKSQDGKTQLQLPIVVGAGQPQFWSNDRLTFSMPFILRADAAAILPGLLSAASAAGTSPVLPLPMPPDSLVRITLEDVDQITSSTPARFTINGIVDQPPVIESRLKGIGTSITRKARIPIAGTITDDYGIANAEFEFRVDDAQEWQKRSFAAPPLPDSREFTLQRAENEEFERFDVLPLDLSTKQRLTLTVSALDGCTVSDGGPLQPGDPSAMGDAAPAPSAAHRSQGIKFTFTIIPEEELLSMLYGRELNLRKRVEQIISECKGTLQELRTQHEKLLHSGLNGSQSSEQISQMIKANSQGLNAAADRSLHGVRKNAIETVGVESAFADIREELINNAADTPAMLERLDRRILSPLNAINVTNFPSLDSSLGLFRFALDKSTNPASSLETSINQLSTLIARLEEVLGEMAEMARFDAVLEELKKTINDELKLLEETKRKRKERAIRALE